MQAWALAWANDQVCWDPTVGCRVPGPGGSQVTKRQRQEKFLLEGLQALFSRLEDLDQDEQEEEPWQTQRRRRPKGGLTAAVAQDQPPRTVWLEASDRPTEAETSVLRQLQQLIVDCQSHGAQGIIGKLRGILNGSRHPANHVPPPPLQPPASRPGQGKGKGKGDKSPLVAPKPPKNVGGRSLRGGARPRPNLRFPLPSSTRSGGRAGLGLLLRLVALLMLEMLLMRTFCLPLTPRLASLRSLQAHIALLVCLLWCVLTFQLLFRRAGATSGYSSTLESGDRPVLRHSQGLSLSGEKSRTWLSVLRTWRCKKLRPPSGRSALRSSFPQLTGRRRSPSLSASWPSCSQKTCGPGAMVGMLKLGRPALSGFLRFRARRVTRCCRHQEREVSSFLLSETRTRQRPRAYGGCLGMTRSLQRFICKQLRSRRRWPPPLSRFAAGGELV